jgi:hypothetical protein
VFVVLGVSVATQEGPLKGIVIAPLPAGLLAELAPPPDDGGVACNATTKRCRAWVAATVPHSEHVGQGVKDPDCGSPTAAINNDILRFAEQAALTLKFEEVNGTWTMSGLTWASAVAFIAVKAFFQIATPETPLGQAIRPRIDKALCIPLVIKLPVQARDVEVAYWTDNVALHTSTAPAPTPGLIGGAPPPMPDVSKWPWRETSPGEDVTFAKFAEPASRIPLLANGVPAGTLVTAIFKQWSGGMMRRTGLVVRYTMP